jgi:hypothetical protein
LKPTEKEQTTSYAVSQIDEYLNLDYNYFSALFFSAIYVHMRLKSLLTDRLRPEKVEWKQVHNYLGSLSFKASVSICECLKLIEPEMSKDLKDLWDLRGKVAHESTPWREPTNEMVREIKRLCKVAMDFLDLTKKTALAQSTDTSQAT